MMNLYLCKSSRLDSSILKQTKSTMHFLNHDSNGVDLKRKIQKKILIINKQSLEKERQFYNWRSKTQLPIAKVFFYKISENNENFGNKVKLQISYECPNKRLSELQIKLPLFQSLYLLKETLIGVERLCHKFGFFTINSSMIFINKYNKCKIWINQDLSLNTVMQIIENENDKEYLSKILRIFEQITLISKNASQFFLNIRKCQNLISAVQFIEEFCRKNKIIISNSLNLNFVNSQGSPNKLFLSKYESSKEVSDNFIKNYEVRQKSIKNKKSRDNFKYEINETDQIIQSPQYKSAYFPKFLSKRSQQFTAISNPANPEDKFKSVLSKSRSFNYFQHLKTSTLTKPEKSRQEKDSSQYDGSNSQFTIKSFKNFDKIPKQPIWSPRTPNQNRKKDRLDFSFKKDSPQKQQGLNFKNIEQQWQTSMNQVKPQTKQARQRKLSNDTVLTKDYNYKGIRIGKKIRASQEGNLLTVNNPSLKKQNHNLFSSLNFPFVLNNIKTSSDTSESVTQQKNLSNIFEQNGWKVQFETLVDTQISLRQSIKDGKQQRSNKLGTTLDFAKLARLGRAIEGSMIPDDEYLNYN